MIRRCHWLIKFCLDLGYRAHLSVHQRCMAGKTVQHMFLLDTFRQGLLMSRRNTMPLRVSVYSYGSRRAVKAWLQLANVVYTSV